MKEAKGAGILGMNDVPAGIIGASICCGEQLMRFGIFTTRMGLASMMAKHSRLL